MLSFLFYSKNKVLTQIPFKIILSIFSLLHYHVVQAEIGSYSNSSSSLTKPKKLAPKKSQYKKQIKKISMGAIATLIVVLVFAVIVVYQYTISKSEEEQHDPSSNHPPLSSNKESLNNLEGGNQVQNGNLDSGSNKKGKALGQKLLISLPDTIKEEKDSHKKGTKELSPSLNKPQPYGTIASETKKEIPHPNLNSQPSQKGDNLPQGPLLSMPLMIKEEENLYKTVARELRAFFKNPDSYGTITSPVKREILQKIYDNRGIGEFLSEFKDIKMKRIKISQQNLDSFYHKKQFTNKQLAEALDKDWIKVKEKGFNLPPYSSKNTKTTQYSTNFANQRLGGDESNTFAQEEALMLLCSLVPVKRYLSTFKTPLARNEIAIIEYLPILGEFDASEVYREKSGKRIKKMLDILKPFNPGRLIHLLCLDAPYNARYHPHQDYKEKDIKHLLNKLFITGIATIEANLDKEKVMIEFGNWGGGSFENNLVVVYALTSMMVGALNAKYKNKNAPLLTMEMHPMDLGEDKLKKALELVVNSLGNMGDEPFSIMDWWDEVKKVAKEKKYSLKTAENCSHGV